MREGCHAQILVAQRFAMAAIIVAALTTPVAASTLAAGTSVPLCRSIPDLMEFEARLAAEDRAGTEMYLRGAQPPCLFLDKGEIVEQLDQIGIHVQVVTRRGVPRFIGWGERSSFQKP